MKRLTIIFLLALVTISCAGIKDLVSGMPGESRARDHYVKVTQGAVDEGYFKIKSFEKTNGEMSADGKSYTLYWKANLEILKDYSITVMFSKQDFHAGDIMPATGQYRYRLTDNGWKLVNDYGQLTDD